jgi:hypothetical protein
LIDDLESSDAGAFVIAITEIVQALALMPIVNTFKILVRNEQVEP